MVEPSRKDALSAELAAARDRLGSHALGLRRTLSPAESIKRGVHHHPAAWFGGAVIAGLLLSRLPARSKKVKVEPRIKGIQGDRKQAANQAGKAALAVTVLKFALDLAKPSLMRLVREKFAAGMAARQRAHSNGATSGGAISFPPRQTAMDVKSPVP